MRGNGLGGRKSSQVELHAVADPVVLKSEGVLERPLPLPLEQDLVGLSADAGSDLSLEET